MITLVSLLNQYEKPLISKYGHRISIDQRKALNAIQHCRTAHYGTLALSCNTCGWQQFKFHSCGHRFCPQCQHYDTTRWLERQSKKLLPVDYFMVSFTLPYELRSLAWRHQKQVYGILFKVATHTLKSFAINDNKMAGDIGMTAVLHTHSRRLEYHPHLHVIVPGGCIDKQRKQWTKRQGKYLFNTFNLSKVFRARFIEALQQEGLRLPSNTPARWVVNCGHVGRGLPALKYLSRYLYRGVLSEKNILQDDGEKVSFQYKDSGSEQFKTRTLRGEDFIWLLLQHVLPKGFRRVRDFGFLHGNAGRTLRLLQLILKVTLAEIKVAERPCFKCIKCDQPMFIAQFIRPSWRSG